MAVAMNSTFSRETGEGLRRPNPGRTPRFLDEDHSAPRELMNLVVAQNDL
jgi:hypothetical protein